MDIEFLKSICLRFFPGAEITDPEQIHNGHINLTYRFTADGRDYILQRINTDIFRDAAGLMHNVCAVTSAKNTNPIANVPAGSYHLHVSDELPNFWQ